MDLDRPATSSSTAPGSKRKRATQDDGSNNNTGLLETNDIIDYDGQTPNKRSRSHLDRQSDADHDHDLSDEATPANQRNLRRKKGSRNLSNLNLRHAASTAKLPPPQLLSRESKFQEGSLNDRPSQQPPSVFTRAPRTDSGNLEYVDELMADYHEGLPTPAKEPYNEGEDADELRPQDVTNTTADQKVHDGSGIFRFGRSWASNFHPVALWNSLFKETKEELTHQNMLEAERKARLKTEAETKYAQMKHAGQLGLEAVTMGNGNTGVSTPRDSGIAFENATSLEHQRATSFGTVLRTSVEDSTRDGSEMPEPPRTLRGRLSRLALRKPSMASLTGTIKRPKSDFNLAASHREASSSTSPIKSEFDWQGSVVKRSASKFDLKRQQRLSKKVSDLESKLQKARSELEGALAEATPAPKLASRYERWTPVSSLRSKQTKFVPGALPTLPSERLLFSDPAEVGDKDATIRAVDNRRSRQPIDLATAFSNVDEGDSTVRPVRGSLLRPPAKEMFERPTGSADVQAMAEASKPDVAVSTQLETAGESMEAEEVDQQDSADSTGDSASGPTKKQSSEVLDAKLQAIDETVKAKKKGARPKKRQPLGDDSGAFKPRKGDYVDDDAEWEEAEQSSAKKKRKSVGKSVNSPQAKSKRGAAGKQQKSPSTKLSQTISTAAEAKQIKAGEQHEQVERVAESIVESQSVQDVETGDFLGSEDELARTQSIEDEVASLEPVYEEEEEILPLKEEPVEPTAIATPARHGRGAPRSRSTSPYKRPLPVQPAPEERLLTRAANAAQKSRHSRSPSPPPAKGYSKQASIVNDTVTITPGLGDIPNLPKAVNGTIDGVEEDRITKKKVHRSKNHASKENFEWPEDVF